VRTPKSDLTCVRNDVDQTFFFDQECVCGVDRTLFAVDEGGETEVEITRKTTHKTRISSRTVSFAVKKNRDKLCMYVLPSKELTNRIKNSFPPSNRTYER